jgi:hypothetical protein
MTQEDLIYGCCYAILKSGARKGQPCLKGSCGIHDKKFTYLPILPQVGVILLFIKQMCN